MDLGAEHLPAYLPLLLKPIYRELGDSNKTGGEELHCLAQEVLDLMKGVCGKEAFSKAYAQVHQTVLSNRERRRQQAALEVWSKLSFSPLRGIIICLGLGKEEPPLSKQYKPVKETELTEVNNRRRRVSNVAMLYDECLWKVTHLECQFLFR